MEPTSERESGTSEVPHLIPITVIGGYLGAGKTTLLNSILRDSAGVRFGVVVNDFGELGLDADLLADASAGGVINLPNGCVCCTLGGDLYEALATLNEVEPRLDQIAIEASGVADPASTAAWGTVAPFCPGGTIVLAAADTIRRQARDRYVGTEVVRQLAGADVLVMTKVDRCDDDELAAVERWLAAQTDAPVVRAVDGCIPIEIIRPLIDVRPARTGRPSAPDIDHGPVLDAMYGTWSFESSAGVSSQSLQSFLDGLPVGVLRLKGTVADPDRPGHGTLVNVVGRRVDHVRIACVEPLIRLEAIGINGVFDEREMDRLATKYLRLE